MNLVFVHGWSVASTETYAGLPEALLAKAAGYGLELNVSTISLGRYISFHDEVTIDDISRALDQALRDTLGDPIPPFSCITHSTGGPVLRTWIHRYYGPGGLASIPLEHLVMLAPANHGSALAQLGKSRVGRIAAWFKGTEPGQGVLNWLELGSAGAWQLNTQWLDYPDDGSKPYFFVLIGQTIDRKLYDVLNSYTDEIGSDGVVRVAAANMNFRRVRLRQTEDLLSGDPVPFRLDVVGDALRRSPRCALGIIPGASHSGEEIGIMDSVTPRRSKPVVDEILKCLAVRDADRYEERLHELEALSRDAQGGDPRASVRKSHRYAMVVFDIKDDQGNPVTDFDMILLGRDYDKNLLPRGFFVDRQKNRLSSHHLTYYVNQTLIEEIVDGKLGIRIIARPNEGFSHYDLVEFRNLENDPPIPIGDLIYGNETLYVEIILTRRVDEETCRLQGLEVERGSFKGTRPSGRSVR